MGDKITIHRTVESEYDHLTEKATVRVKNELGMVVEALVFDINSMMDKVLLQAIPTEKLTALYNMVKNEFDSRNKVEANADEPPSEIFVLLADSDGTMRSIPVPFGVAVDSIDEAQKFKDEGKYAYEHDFEKLRVFQDKDKALAFSLGLPRLITNDHIAFVIDFLTKNGRTEQMKIREAMTNVFGLPSVELENFMSEVKFTERLMTDTSFSTKQLKRESATISDSVFYSISQ